MALTDNISAYWKLDESSGNASDSTGNSFTLTNVNTVTYSTGKINNGGNFGSTNTNKFLSNASTLGMTIDTARTYAGWVNVTTSPSTGSAVALFAHGYSTNNVVYTAEYVNTAGTFSLRVGRARNGVDDPNMAYNVTLTTGTWFHIAYTMDAGLNQILYVNGVQTASSLAPSGNGSSSVSTQILFGLDDYGVSRYFSGLVDEWGVWNRVLSSTEILQLYKNNSGSQYPFLNSGGFLMATAF